MALVVFLRGVNVGGHRTFRPSLLAKTLRKYDVVNVGAAGTFIVRKHGSRAKFRAELISKLPFEAEIVFCEGRELIRMYKENPFRRKASSPEIVRFVSMLSRIGSLRTPLPVAFPNEDAWLVRVIGSQSRFVFGEYRRHMKTIGYLAQIDKLFAAPATTRNWNTIVTIVRLLQGQKDENRKRKSASH